MTIEILLTQSTYDPLTLPVGEVELRNEHSGPVEICELTPGTVGDEIRVRLLGHNGTPSVYIGTEGSLSIVPGDNNRFPRAMPLDEIAVLTFAAGAGPTGGDAWSLVWE